MICLPITLNTRYIYIYIYIRPCQDPSSESEEEKKSPEDAKKGGKVSKANAEKKQQKKIHDDNSKKGAKESEVKVPKNAKKGDGQKTTAKTEKKEDTKKKVKAKEQEKEQDKAQLKPKKGKEDVSESSESEEASDDAQKDDSKEPSVSNSWVPKPHHPKHDIRRWTKPGSIWAHLASIEKDKESEKEDESQKSDSEEDEENEDEAEDSSEDDDAEAEGETAGESDDEEDQSEEDQEEESSEESEDETSKAKAVPEEMASKKRKKEEEKVKDDPKKHKAIAKEKESKKTKENKEKDKEDETTLAIVPAESDDADKKLALAEANMKTNVINSSTHHKEWMAFDRWRKNNSRFPAKLQAALTTKAGSVALIFVWYLYRYLLISSQISIIHLILKIWITYIECLILAFLAVHVSLLWCQEGRNNLFRDFVESNGNTMEVEAKYQARLEEAQKSEVKWGFRPYKWLCDRHGSAKADKIVKRKVDMKLLLVPSVWLIYVYLID